MRLISIEQLKEWEIFKIALLYTDQKCSYKQIPDLMQAFPLDTEIYYFEIKCWQVKRDS